MLVLLPPSETKATRTRGAALDWEGLSWPELTPDRAQVEQALAAVSQQPDAAEVLGVSPNLGEEIARNTRLLTAPTLPASAMYTGVLYDALNLSGLKGGEKTRANRRIVISSALYGAVRPNDRLAPYRLSMAVNLPGVGPVASFWKPRLTPLLDEAAGDGLIVDGRSSTYAASWTPSGEQQAKWLHVRVPGATHMAKHTRGLFAAYLMTLARPPKTPSGLATKAKEAFEVALHEPASAKKPWILDVAAR